MDASMVLGWLVGPLGAFVVALGALGLAAMTAGADSRPGMGDDHQRTTESEGR
jgi:hypothetical protein